jgi:beta-lactamase regulating signal transducer with metallopeptidase domain
MINRNNSYLRTPPKLLHPEQVQVFDAIRYSIDICEISHRRLLKNLFEITENKINPLDFPMIFLDIWSIINNSVLFKKIICREFNLNSRDEPYLKEINKANKLRDSNQHIDERLSQVYTNTDLPIYGSLSWRRYYSDSDLVLIPSIFSGTFTIRKKISIKVSNQNNDLEELNDLVQRIEFTNIVRERNKKTNTYNEEKILINNIMLELKWWVNHFEKQLIERFKEIDVTERHKSDLILKIEGFLL